MPDYERGDARAWAREHLVGCSGVTIPTFTADLKRLNEAAFATTSRWRSSSASRTRCCVPRRSDHAGGERAVHRLGARDRRRRAAACSSTPPSARWTRTSSAVKLAETAGADLVLLSYPPQFWPTTEQEVYDYTKAFCDATDLGVMLFPLPAWGFERIHPGRHVGGVRAPRCSTRCPNIVAIKSEQGFPLPAGVCEMYHHFRDEVVISCPIEARRDPAHGRDEHAVLRHQQHRSGWATTTRAPSSWPARGEWRRRWSAVLEGQPARSANGGRHADLHRRHERPEPRRCGSTRTGWPASTAGRCARRRCACPTAS